jgi:hypothetical protein
MPALGAAYSMPHLARSRPCLHGTTETRDSHTPDTSQESMARLTVGTGTVRCACPADQTDDGPVILPLEMIVQFCCLFPAESNPIG